MNQEEKDDTVLLFLDFETTGVDPEKDYPIEIGCIATDITAQKVFFRYESLIKFDAVQLVDNADSKKEIETWKEEYAEGFKYHKIPAAFWYASAKGSSTVKREIEQALLRATEGREHWILVSDNIQFEYRFMQNIYKNVYGDNWQKEWPFHYCGWDTSLLLEASGVGDPRGVPHRALADTELVLEATREAMRILKHNQK